MSTIGEAPLWVSLLFLSHEIITRVLPALITIWLATTAVSVYRVAARPRHASRRAPQFAPHAGACDVARGGQHGGRSLVHRLQHLLRVLYIGGPDMKRRPADDATRRPPHVTTVIYVAARALIRETHADLSLWGG